MIRALGPEDGPEWHALWTEAFTRFPDCFLTTLAEHQARDSGALAQTLAGRLVLGWLEQGRLLGTLSLVPMERAACAHRAWISGVFVRPERQGSGMADLLMAAAEAEARNAGHRQLELHVQASNGRAIRFYERHEFGVAGRLPRAVLRDGRFHDDLHMVKALD